MQPGVEEEGGADDGDVEGAENLDPRQEAIEPRPEDCRLFTVALSIAVGQGYDSKRDQSKLRSRMYFATRGEANIEWAVRQPPSATSRRSRGVRRSPAWRWCWGAGGGCGRNEVVR